MHYLLTIILNLFFSPALGQGVAEEGTQLVNPPADERVRPNVLPDSEYIQSFQKIANIITDCTPSFTGKVAEAIMNSEARYIATAADLCHAGDRDTAQRLQIQYMNNLRRNNPFRGSENCFQERKEELMAMDYNPMIQSHIFQAAGLKPYDESHICDTNFIRVVEDEASGGQQ